MYERHLRDQKLHELIEKIDWELAEEARGKGCPHCGENLHWADYPRKPRGGLLKWDRRHSLCCGQEGCRRRLTPTSLRFLGRKVYSGLVVVLMSAMNQGLSAARVSELRRVIGIGRRTLERWRQWWLRSFVASRIWKAGRAFFMPPVEESQMPWSLCERYGGEVDQVCRLLRFIAETPDPPGYSRVAGRTQKMAAWPGKSLA